LHASTEDDNLVAKINENKDIPQQLAELDESLIKGRES